MGPDAPTALFAREARRCQHVPQRETLSGHSPSANSGIPDWVRGLRIGCVVVGAALMARSCPAPHEFAPLCCLLGGVRSVDSVPDAGPLYPPSPQGVYVMAFGVTGQQTTYFYNQVAGETKGEDIRIFLAAAAEIAALALLMLHIGTYAITQSQFELVLSLTAPGDPARNRYYDRHLEEGGGAYKSFASLPSVAAGSESGGSWDQGNTLAQESGLDHIVAPPKIKTGRENSGGG